MHKGNCEYKSHEDYIFGTLRIEFWVHCVNMYFYL